MRSITIDLPLPPKELHPNARANRWDKAAATRRARADARMLMRSEFANRGMYEMWQRARWKAEYTFHVNRYRDEDGLVSWLKAYLDGAVTDARLLPGDDARYLSQYTAPRVVINKRQPEGVRLTFIEHDDTALCPPTSNAAPSVSTNPAEAAASSPPSASRSRRGRS